MSRYYTNFERTQEFEVKIRQFNVKQEISDAMYEVLQEDLIDMITDNVRDRGLVGTGVDDGDGVYNLSSNQAWFVDEKGNMEFVIRTRGDVADYAFYLEYGTDGPITPNQADALKFKPKDPTMPTDEDGYIYRNAVESVDEYRFFRDALDEFDTSKRVQEKLGREVSNRVESALTLS